MMVQKESFKRLFNRRDLWRLLIVLLILCFAGACATLPKEADLKASLRSTAEEYWNKRMQDKYEDTYKMEDKEGLPSFNKYRDLCLLMRKIDVVSHSIKEVSVDGDKGTVMVQFDMKLPNIPKPLPQPLTDYWIYRDGQWKHVPRRS